MDANVHNDMEAVREAEETGRHQWMQTSAEVDEASKRATERVKQVLSLAAADYLGEDSDRLQWNAQQPSLGFSIEFQFPGDNPGAAWALPSFDIVATVTGDQVTLSAKDGHWAYIDGFLGNWANWTDEVLVFRDRLVDAQDDRQLRKALDQAFLTWYKRVTNVQ